MFRGMKRELVVAEFVVHDATRAIIYYVSYLIASTRYFLQNENVLFGKICSQTCVNNTITVSIPSEQNFGLFVSLKSKFMKVCTA